MPAPRPNVDLTRPACGQGLCNCPQTLPSVLNYKYGQLWAWRLSHEALGRDAAPMRAPGARAQRRRALAQLSGVYPGALRELERIGPQVLHWRQRQAAQTRACASLWLRLVWDYHALWHRALAFRRFCRLHSASRQPFDATHPALAGCFASWYERAARHTPWIGHVLPASWHVPQRGAQGQTLKQAIHGLLERQYALGPECIAHVLWSEVIFDVPKPGRHIREQLCR